MVWYLKCRRNRETYPFLQKYCPLSGKRSRIGYGQLLVGMILAIVFGILITFWAYLHILYDLGAGSKARGWIVYMGWETFNRLQTWLVSPREASGPELGVIGSSFLFTIFLMIMKIRFLWWPLHPGGYVLVSGTGMGGLWFPIFLSWLAKAIVLKLGGVKLYRQAVPFFLGLILGDYTLGCVWSLTGIGYDLEADRNNENGGTPGYHKDSLKSKASEVAGDVSISEIMLATGTEEDIRPAATRLPQWIELYNASSTQGVNINNWYLELHNSNLDRDLNLSATLRLPNITIPPNQTVMIVSNSALNSGNFSEARTINLYTNGTYRNALNLRSRGDSVLSEEGFYIEIRDHENKHVDEIGNLGVSRRTGIAGRGDDAEIWELPSLHSEDGHRTSLIRVYDDRTNQPGDGLLAESWRRASDTNFRHIPSLTYFGNHRDFGTPGYRGGGPLPVSLSKFRPERLETGEVVIRWVTESELNNAGFNILRTEKRDGVFEQVNPELIQGQGTTSGRNAYKWTDTTAKPHVVYYYQIQDVSLDGQVQTLRISRLKGNISAAGKATTTWGSLKARD